MERQGLCHLYRVPRRPYCAGFSWRTAQVPPSTIKSNFGTSSSNADSFGIGLASLEPKPARRMHAMQSCEFLPVFGCELRTDIRTAD